MKGLRQITVIGLGLLGGSIASGVLRCFSGVKVVGYAHRRQTREKALELAIATEISDSLEHSVLKADLVILATPISKFGQIYKEIKDSLPDGCIVTDVGSTKVVPYKRAMRLLPDTVHYVGSHPIAGSEQRGVDFARDDLCSGALCILTVTKSTNLQAVQVLENFWIKLGCFVKVMTPAEHDRIFATVSHVPHLIAAGMINATDSEEMLFAGKGFIDTSRIASGPADIWTDILLTNHENTVKGIDNVIGELKKIKKAISRKDSKQIEKLLNLARDKRAALIDYKIEQKEII